MKRRNLLIITIFILCSIFSFSAMQEKYTIPLGEKKVTGDFNFKVALGILKEEKKNDLNYKKFFDYIDENLSKNGEVSYYGGINFRKRLEEITSEKGEVLYSEGMSKEALAMIELAKKFEDKEHKGSVDKFLETFMNVKAKTTIIKKDNLLKLIEERVMGDEENKIETITETIFKRELTEAEKKEILALKDAEEIVAKYKSYIQISEGKGYENGKLKLIQRETENETTATMYGENGETQKIYAKKTDDDNAEMKMYLNDNLETEVITTNGKIIQREYYSNGKIKSEETYQEDKTIRKAYHENGKLSEEIISDNKGGNISEKYYDKNGKIIKEKKNNKSKKVK